MAPPLVAAQLLPLQLHLLLVECGFPFLVGARVQVFQLRMPLGAPFDQGSWTVTPTAPAAG
jgi:hypothetical protein